MAGKRATPRTGTRYKGGHFVTSSHSVNAAPAWLEGVERATAAHSFAATSLGAPAGGPRAVTSVRGARRRRRRMSRQGHRPSRVASPRMPAGRQLYDGLERTPFADAILLESRAAMAGHPPRRRRRHDMLAISFSACDVVGQRVRPRQPGDDRPDTAAASARSACSWRGRPPCGQGWRDRRAHGHHGDAARRNLVARRDSHAPRARRGPGADRGRRAGRTLPERGDLLATRTSSSRCSTRSRSRARA